MSSEAIRKKLVAKGYPVTSVTYCRNAPTPSGLAKGYDIELVNINDSFVEIEDLVFDYDKNIEISNSMEMDDLASVLKWVESLPNLKTLRKGGE
ncbi:hypothetical protein [Alteromonas australica]|uniref:Uncharacterized protein n=2 Tax=Alteromonas australica TaxID=589873 RepID=A0A358E2F5_9ALTE|nr:hypothetical protein [Alteromonas australica]MBU35356.1 hypothetical protein [Alteromonas sp.]HBU52155.1 hypothetical protein [Alteromonas australica]|tara:strand:+ start:44988 stop:45269 length:282 start_codon:yes stop_codon:yes gene_type:complete